MIKRTPKAKSIPDTSSNLIETNRPSTLDEKPESKTDQPHEGYQAKPAYTSHKEWEEDRRSLAKARHDALNGFLEATVIQRSDLLRDLLAVSITILLGTLTFYFASDQSHNQIKSQWLFFFGLLILATGTALNLIARSEIVRHLEQVAYQIERGYLDIFETSRDVMKNPSQFNIDTSNRIESSSITFARLNWVGEHGHRFVVWSILVCVITVSLSFILDIRL